MRPVRRDGRAEATHCLEVELRTEGGRPVSLVRALEEVGVEVWHYRFAIVAVKKEPRREVHVLTHGRTATKLPIVVGLSKLADRATHVPSPVILEGDVSVGVVSPLQWQAFGCPPLPPVVVQLEAVVEESRLAIEESGPGAPGNLIGATQIAEVVHLEAWRAARIRGLEHQVLSADFAESHFFGVTAQRCAAAIEWKIGVGALEEVHAVVL